MGKSILRRLSGNLGAEILDVDLNVPLDEETGRLIDSALYEHVVLLFRGQALSPAAQVAFTERYGAVEEHPLRTRKNVPGFPGVLVLENTPGRPGATNEHWHSDISHAECPPALSLLQQDRASPPWQVRRPLVLLSRICLTRHKRQRRVGILISRRM